MAEGHALLLVFDTDDSEFGRGFEAGAIWARLRAEPSEPLGQIAHGTNAELMIRMGEALNRPAKAELFSDEEGDWIMVEFGPAEDDDA